MAPEVEDCAAVVETRHRRHTSRRHLRSTKAGREQDRYAFLTRLSPLHSQLRSVAAERLNIQAIFFDKYTSQNSPFPSCEYFALNHVAMQTAMDSLSLLVLGNSTKRMDLVQRGCSAYPKALQCLRHELSVVPVRQPFVLLQTIHVLQLCEMFQSISSNGWGWTKHMRGLGAIIRAASPEDRTHCGTQGRQLIERDTRISFPLWEGLVFRRHMPSGEELFGTPSIPPDVEMSSRLASDRLVPDVLCYADNLVRSSCRASVIETSNAIAAIMSMESRLHESMASWYQTLPQMAYRTTNLNSFRRSEIVTAVESNVFPYAYSFPSLASALKHTHYWMCLLALRQTRIRIRKTAKSFEYELNQAEGLHQLLRRTAESADDLCMSMAFMTSRENGFLGLFAAVPPIQMACEWFAAEKQDQKMQWCQSVARCLRRNGLAIPAGALEEAEGEMS